ncbi:unnamed protein product [Aureobasidium uvarum]|uniref:Gluconokinase n=1 Tax=Aureobasidium uvarum TaxID=2773716 RepID=A0A9N8KM35_9PEZI|nr:unnamed protein product [Aureobasidium uvarum]
MLHYEKTPVMPSDHLTNAPATPMPNSSSVNATVAAGTAVVPQHRHIWIITGPAGCGKTSVAEYLSTTFALPYLEGDSMANNIPLTDADRWDWLILLRDQAVSALSTGAPGVVLTCSALKRKYRDVIRVASYNDNNVLVHFIYLSATQELLLQRVHGRVGHYMKDSMVKSQFEALEPPTKDERDVMSVDVSGDFASVQALAVEVVNQVMASDAVIVEPVQA